MLVTEGPVAVFPTPVAHCGHCAGKAAFGRDLPDHVPAVPRPSPHVGQTEEVEGGPIRCGMARTLSPLWGGRPKHAKKHVSVLDAILTPAIAGSSEVRFRHFGRLAARGLEIAAVRRDVVSHQWGDAGEIFVGNDVAVGAKPSDDSVDVDRVPDQHLSHPLISWRRVSPNKSM